MTEDTTDANGAEHDEKGRFTGKGGSGEQAEAEKRTVVNSGKSDKIRYKYDIIYLPKDEFAHVQSVFMTDVTREERREKILTIYYGDYVYMGILRKDGTRDIISKREI